MIRFAANFVPWLLTYKQKHQRVATSQELLHLANAEENF
jgi:hypothetical protein